MIYFRGCVVREKLPKIADATEKLLKKAGVPYTIIENESCCGSFLKRTGFETEAHEVMAKTLKHLNDNETVLNHVPAVIAHSKMITKKYSV